MINELLKDIGVTYLDGSSGFPGFLYHPIPFKEYLHIPVHKTNCIEEIRLLSEVYDFKEEKVLEVGAASGWFTFQIANKAKEYIAYEADPNVFKVLKYLKEEKSYDNVTLKNRQFSDVEAEEMPEVDVVLMLNVAMWIHKQIGADRSLKMLQRLKCKTLFYQTAHAESNGMYKMEELKNQQDIEAYLKSAGFTPRLLAKTIHDEKPRLLFICNR